MQLIIQLDPVAGEGSGSWAGGFDLSHGLVTGSLGEGFHSWLRGLVEQGSRIFRKWHSFLLVFTINLILVAEPVLSIWDWQFAVTAIRDG